MKIIKKEMVFIKRTVSGFFYVFLLLTVGMEYSVGLIDKEKNLKTLNCRVLRFTKLIFNGISLWNNRNVYFLGVFVSQCACPW